MTKLCKFLTKVILKHILLLAQTSNRFFQRSWGPLYKLFKYSGSWRMLPFLALYLYKASSYSFFSLNWTDTHTFSHHFYTFYERFTFVIDNRKKFFSQPWSQIFYKDLCVAKRFFFYTITPHTTEIFSHLHTIVVITKINHFLITVDTPAGQNEFFQEEFSQWEKI